MLIYTENISPRLRYVLNFIFRDVFRIEYSISDSIDEFRASNDPKISYSSDYSGDALSVPFSGFLSQSGIAEPDLRLDKSSLLPLLFTSARKSSDDLGFDLFAAVFYMISRYEEYLPFEADQHLRFEAGSSLAARNGFLEIPVVDRWVDMLREKLMSRFDGLSLRSHSFNYQPTCDIDLPFAYLHRGRARTLGARMKSLFRGGDDKDLRRKVLRGRIRDPFDTFTEMEAIHALHNLRPKIFFLTSGYGKFDKSISPRRAVFKNLVKQTIKYAEVGIHPSYRSSGNPKELKKEIERLSGIKGESIRQSRQHFLKFRIPGNYRNYIEEGIQEEYSMGFASAAGFRAGTAMPFFFYDILMEEETSLKVIPFQVMDRTLKDYMKLTPEQSIAKIREIADNMRKTGGCFVSIWHNDAFSDHGEWKGWKDVYLQMIDSLKD